MVSYSLSDISAPRSSILSRIASHAAGVRLAFMMMLGPWQRVAQSDSTVTLPGPSGSLSWTEPVTAVVPP